MVVLGGAREGRSPEGPGASRHGPLPERPYYDGAFVEREKERTVSKPRIAALLTVALVSAFGAAACGGGGGGEAQQAEQLQQRVERLERQVEQQQQQLDEQQLVLDQQVRETVKEEETQPDPLYAPR